MNKEEERFEKIEREYLAPPNREVVGEMMREFADDPDDDAEFETWVYFENGKRIEAKRPNPRYKPSKRKV